MNWMWVIASNVPNMISKPEFLLLLTTVMLKVVDNRQNLSLAKTDVNNPETFLTVSQVLVKNGYPVETHTILTEDGYFLTVHHIPQKKHDVSKVVVIFRCLSCNSYVYLALGPSKSLGYLLADAGYDVWLTDLRGNSYSSAHVTLRTHQAQFWNFTWHEMGVYDVPAVLDYVITKTGADKVHIIGFSMGTTATFVTGAMRPEYMSRIRLFIALAPVTYRSHAGGLAALLARILTPEVMELIPNEPLLPNEVLELVRFLGRKVCSTHLTATVICKTISALAGGKDSTNLNETVFPVVLGHMPDQESINTVLHYLQGFTSCKFRQYDYGVDRNLRVYGRRKPPQYNLRHITAPVALIWSVGDTLANTKKQINNTKFSHMDFVLGNDALEVNKDVLSLLDNWSGHASL